MKQSKSYGLWPNKLLNILMSAKWQIVKAYFRGDKEITLKLKFR